jgi:photosystem II stability/assembly factor-like uncharacterized protein
MRFGAATSVLVCAVVACACGASPGLRIENSGQTAQVTRPVGSQPHVRSLDAAAFVSDTRGWAAGQNAIIATSDGGGTWTQQFSGRADIRSLDFVDERSGWAVASTELLRTTDGGDTWQPAGEPAGRVLTGVEFVSSSQGWGLAVPSDKVGAQPLGTLVRTTDAGATWSVVQRNVANSICVSGATLIAGAGSRVLRSSDGGSTWTPLLDPATASNSWFGAVVQCAGSSSIWALFEGGGAAGSEGYAAYTSSNSGASWRPAVVAPIVAGSDPAFRGVVRLDAYPGPFAAVSAANAVFLGQCPACDPQHAMVLRTEDGGRHWGRHVINGFVPTALAFPDAEHGWMATQLGGYPGRHAAILATTDGGRTWHPVFPA